METILVTGGAGFIGGAYVRQLVPRGEFRIINLDKLTYAGNLDSLAPIWNDPNHIFVHGDIGDTDLVKKLCEQYQPTSIVNFAAESHVDRSIDSQTEFINTNVHGTARLLETSRDYWSQLPADQQGQFRFIQISTDEVYGSLGSTGLFSEQTPFSPNSPYAASKAAADHFVNAFHHTFGLPTITTHCSNNYGPYQFPEKLIPLMIQNASEGKPLPVYGDGLNIRDWLFVDDHCAAIESVRINGRVGERYNIGGNSERNNIDVVTSICRLIDTLRPEIPHHPCESLIKYVTDRPGHDRRYAIDASKIRDELGWQPTQTFETGLELTVAWYLNNQDWVQRVTSGSYQRERLGLSLAKC